MSDPAERVRREAGEHLFYACEAALGVEGPAALERLTARRRSWWSKLRSGGDSALPSWEKLLTILPSSVDSASLNRLRARHQEAWLRLHDPGLLWLLHEQTRPAIPRPVLAATRTAAGYAFERGDYGTALQCLRFVESSLQVDRREDLPGADLVLLGKALEEQCMCLLHLDQSAAATVAVQRAEIAFRMAGDLIGETYAGHQLGLAYHKATRYDAAMRQFHDAQERYARLDLRDEAARAIRDSSFTLLAQGRVAAAERAMMDLLSAPYPLSLREAFLTRFYLVSISQARGDLEKARYWLAQAGAIADASRREASVLFQQHHIRERYLRLRAELHRRTTKG